MGKRGPKPLSEEERKQRAKESDARYYAKNKEKYRQRYLAKIESEAYAKTKVEHILASLTEQQRELLVKTIVPPSPDTPSV